MRFDIFRDNYKKIVDHNAISIKKTQFEMGINQFTDLTVQEFFDKTSSGAKVPQARADKMKDFRFDN